MIEGLNGKDEFINVKSLFKQNVDYYTKQAEKYNVDFDFLRLYFGEDYQVNEHIVIHQPTIQTIIDMGEKEFYSAIAPFTTNPSAFKVQLWDLGYDWNKITDFELFALLIKTVSIDKTKILFDDIDFSSFELYAKENKNGEPIPVLYSAKMGFEIDTEIYLKIRKYLCFMFNVKLENMFVTGKTLKEEIVEKERADNAKKLAESKGSNLLQMISFAVNHPGFKYKKNELRDVGYVEFIDSIKRLQIYESTRALTQGSYSGFCDTSKISQEQFNFMRSADE